MSSFNRLGSCHNKYQGNAKRVLCVCWAGLLRSPTVAWVLGNAPYDYNTRAAGIDTEFALIPVDEVLIEWADEIVCVEPSVHRELLEKFPTISTNIVVLNIPDKYELRDPEVVKLIEKQYEDSMMVRTYMK